MPTHRQQCPFMLALGICLASRFVCLQFANLGYEMRFEVRNTLSVVLCTSYYGHLPGACRADTPLVLVDKAQGNSVTGRDLLPGSTAKGFLQERCSKIYTTICTCSITHQCSPRHQQPATILAP
uniref:Uncharacterized protein n=1 Tax=Eutreptiella gymnastica TaxID=73025 RepID=A0A7S4G318_9EUGL